MKELNANWFAEGIIDFEHKKYLLLAYLKYVSKQFDSTKLYPILSDLLFHYKSLKSLRDNQELVRQSMPKKLRKFDLDKFRLEYEQIMNDDEYMVEIASILDFAIPRIQRAVKDGKEIYEIVEENLEIEPIGILPIQKEFGYMMVKNGDHSDTQVFEYNLSIFENASEKFRSMRTSYVNSYQHHISNSFESIKIDLLRRNRTLPNPATYLVYSLIPFPLNETLLPIAKRSLVRFIYS